MADKNKDDTEDETATFGDETVAEFLHDRHERILTRRGRIGEKLAKRKENLREVGSVASSLEFSGSSPDDTPSGAGVGHASGTGDGTSATTGSGGKTKGRDKKPLPDPLDIQIDESRKQLEQMIIDGENLITNVKIAAECREKIRHQKETESKRDRLNRLREEADECERMYEELKPNWDMKAEKKLPLDLFEGVKSQMQACEELLMKKQDLIQTLQQELEENDFEYEQNLEMYQKDVSLIGDRIDDCVDEMQAAFLNELGLIEDYTCRNREVQLEENQREWMELLAEFQTMEEHNLDQRKQDALNKFKSLNELYVLVKQECRAQRHKSEDDLRVLIQELEEVKYSTQLNMEKLQYNLAIVRKRYKETVEMKNMMKRLLLKFNDRFTAKSKALRKKMEDGKKEAKRILGDISKLEDSLDQFGRKTLHLAVSDWQKYMDLWTVSEEMVRDRVQRLLDSEKYIFETQLGIDAPMPELSFMDERPQVVTKYITKKNSAYSELVGSTDNSKSSQVENSKSVSSISAESTDSREETRRQSNSACKNASLILLASGSIEFVPGPDPDPEIQRRLMKHVAKVICDESGFLVEAELRRLVEPLVETERNLVNLDALLKALGINSVGEMQYLAHFLLRRCRVTKGIMSRIGSDVSAHVSEMNMSLTGIVGKNAVDDWESSPGSTNQSISPPINVHLIPDSETGSKSSEYKVCEVDRKTKSAAETSHNVPSSFGGLDDDDVDDEVCALLPELRGIDEQRLSYGDFTQELVQCSPKCCSVDSLGEEETTLEEAIVTLEEDDEGLLDESAGETEAVTVASKCSTCGGEPHDHQDCSFYSDIATVFSWVDPLDPPNKERREQVKKSLLPAEMEGEVEEELETIEIPQQLQESVEADSTVQLFISLDVDEQMKVEGSETDLQKRPSATTKIDASGAELQKKSTVRLKIDATETDLQKKSSVTIKVDASGTDLQKKSTVRIDATGTDLQKKSTVQIDASGTDLQKKSTVRIDASGTDLQKKSTVLTKLDASESGTDLQKKSSVRLKIDASGTDLHKKSSVMAKLDASESGTDLQKKPSVMTKTDEQDELHVPTETDVTETDEQEELSIQPEIDVTETEFDEQEDPTVPLEIDSTEAHEQEELLAPPGVSITEVDEQNPSVLETSALEIDQQEILTSLSKTDMTLTDHPGKLSVSTTDLTITDNQVKQSVFSRTDQTETSDTLKQSETEAVAVPSIEVLREPVRVFSEMQAVGGADPMSEQTDGDTKMGQEWNGVEADDTLDTVSILSLGSSSNDSDEFMYITPEEVIEALAEFCKEYNAKITIELPTLDELIDRKLTSFKYPNRVSVNEYWDRPVRMLSIKSDDLWEGMQYSFEEFNTSLKKRNLLVDEVLDLYRKNYELSFLMKNHIATANRRFLPTSSGSGTRTSGGFC